jgi:predicted signal transduction protein with EAL and GGDEF domain
MSFIANSLPEEQRRMKITLIAMGVNYALFAMGIIAILMGKNFDFSDMGAGLALVNTPIITFIIGESIRPTGYKNKQTTTTSTSSETGDIKEITTHE